MTLVPQRIPLTAACCLLLAAAATLLPLPAAAIKLKNNRGSMTLLGDETESRLYFDSCDQSSSKRSCYLAIDSSTNLEPPQCAVTLPEDQPWWQGILEKPSYISKVTLHNIDKSFMTLMDALTSLVLSVNDDVCFRYESNEVFDKWTFTCNKLGDRITVRSNRKASSMALCEVEVIGVPLNFPTVLESETSLPSIKCEQSSVEGEAYCSYAVDGDRNSDHNTHSCAVTQPESNPWLLIQLRLASIVSQVILYNRGDSGTDGLQNFIITVNGATCANYEGEPIHTKAFNCRYFGDTIRVVSQQENTAMSICEIEIMGYQAALQEPKSFEDLGCYKDSVQDRDFAQFVSSIWMSHKKCHQICKRHGAKYFALQAAKHCICGAAFGKHGKAEPTACALPCDGDESQICGGPIENSVFEI